MGGHGCWSKAATWEESAEAARPLQTSGLMVLPQLGGLGETELAVLGEGQDKPTSQEHRNEGFM